MSCPEYTSLDSPSWQPGVPDGPLEATISSGDDASVAGADAALPHVLLVDHDPVSRSRRLEALSERCGAVVETAPTGEAGLVRILAAGFDAVVTSATLPDMSAFELVTRTAALHPGTPLIVVGTTPVSLPEAGELVTASDDEYLVRAVQRALRDHEERRRATRRRARLERRVAELERVLSDRTHELTEAIRVKDEFLATLSHELRTPLSAVLGWIRLLRRGLEEDEREQALASIERNARAQCHLIDALLDASEMMTGRLRLDPRPVDLRRVVESAVEGVSAAATAKGIRVHCVVSAEALAVRGDRDRLRQAIWNLLSNAVRFTRPGGLVSVRLESGEACATLDIRDTGAGISPDFLPHVFDRFQQGPGSRLVSRAGLGLGLAIVRHVVEAHGGTVSAASEGVERGSIFTVRLPLAPATDAVQPAGPERSAELAGVRVLLIDDDPDACELMALVLNAAGGSVRMASSVPMALEKLDQEVPDVILCDIGLPGEDGYSFIRKVRARGPERGGPVPAAALTAYVRSDDRRRALDEGFDVHICKPVEPSELTAAVAALAGRREVPLAGPRAR